MDLPSLGSQMLKDAVKGFGNLGLNPLVFYRYVSLLPSYQTWQNPQNKRSARTKSDVSSKSYKRQAVVVYFTLFRPP